ncbi:MAG: hypothetical protein IJ309_06520 [Clostridia bacterium]|nr:hypothetical protein [Clostridia bacterium]
MWTKDKKLLEERLASSLQGKLEYKMEGGRKTSSGLTYKVDIIYNDECILSFSEGLDYLCGRYESDLRQKISNIQWTKEESHMLFLKYQGEMWFREEYTTSIFFKGMKEYLSLPIDKALAHEQYMIRFFAILDRRCGKRRLKNMISEIKNYPNALQMVYKLRLKSEGILIKTEN